MRSDMNHPAPSHRIGVQRACAEAAAAAAGCSPSGAEEAIHPSGDVEPGAHSGQRVIAVTSRSCGQPCTQASPRVVSPATPRCWLFLNSRPCVRREDHVRVRASSWRPRGR